MKNSSIKGVVSLPQQIFIPGLSIGSTSQKLTQDKADIPIAKASKSKTGDLNSLAYRLNENQLNDLFNLLNSNQNDKYFNNPLAKHEAQIQERNSIRKQPTQAIPKPELLKQTNEDIEKYFKEAATKKPTEAPTTTTTSTTTTTNPPPTTTTATTTMKPVTKPRVVLASTQKSSSKTVQQQMSMYRNSLQKQNKNHFAFNNPTRQSNFGSMEPMSLTDCSIVRDSRQPDPKYCNLYHLCSNGIYQALLCPESYLYSTVTMKCEHRSKVDCNSRMAVDFDRSNVPDMDFTANDYYNSARIPTIINGTLECLLGSDGYFADPEFCNIYHHCLAGVDYAEQCPHQLVWNDKKKMCDWQTKVNCTGHIIPVASGQTTFCSDKPDNKYADAIYCNVFHHCVGGIDNVVRCEEELQWNDDTKECAWERDVKCIGK